MSLNNDLLVFELRRVVALNLDLAEKLAALTVRVTALEARVPDMVKLNPT